MTIDNFVVMAVIVGLTEIAKKAIPETAIRYTPVAALIIGIGITAISQTMLDIQSWQEIVMVGLVNGLSAIGLYSGVTNTLDIK